MHCAGEISHSNIANLLAGLMRFYFSYTNKTYSAIQCKLKSYSLIFPAAQLYPSELKSEICHHAKPLCLTTFLKTPQLLAPRCSPTSTQTQVNVHTHAVIHIQNLADNEANSQTNTNMFTTCPTNGFFSPLFLSLQAQQTSTDKSLFVFRGWLLCQRMF